MLTVTVCRFRFVKDNNLKIKVNFYIKAFAAWIMSLQIFKRHNFEHLL